MTHSKTANARRGQSTLELVWLVVAIVTIIVAMQTILRRAVGGRYRSSIDQLSQQHFNPTEPYNVTLRSHGGRRDTTDTTGATDSTVGEYTFDPSTGKTNPIPGSGELTRQSTDVGSDTEVVVNKTGTLN